MWALFLPLFVSGPRDGAAEQPASLPWLEYNTTRPAVFDKSYFPRRAGAETSDWRIPPARARAYSSLATLARPYAGALSRLNKKKEEKTANATERPTSEARSSSMLIIGSKRYSRAAGLGFHVNLLVRMNATQVR